MNDVVTPRFNEKKDKWYIQPVKEIMIMAKNCNPLTEKVLVSADTKQALMSIKEPGERYGDVIERVLQDRKRQDFIAHLDRIAEVGEFVPLDSDPEYASLKKEMRRESKNRQAGAAVR
jgi:predicted CopG family antitoxin